MTKRALMHFQQAQRRRRVVHSPPPSIGGAQPVAPERRNQGIGGALVGGVVSIARNEGWGQPEVHVDVPDVEAMRFYERRGLNCRDTATGHRALVWCREL